MILGQACGERWVGTDTEGDDCRLGLFSDLTAQIHTHTHTQINTFTDTKESESATLINHRFSAGGLPLPNASGVERKWLHHASYNTTRLDSSG